MNAIEKLKLDIFVNDDHDIALDRVVATVGCCGIANRRAVRAAVKRGIRNAGYATANLKVIYDDGDSHTANVYCDIPQEERNGLDMKSLADLADLERYISADVSWCIHDAVWDAAVAHAG